MMDVIKINGGATLEFYLDKFVVISTTGVRTVFDKNGNILEPKEEVSWMKYFFFMGKEERGC